MITAPPVRPPLSRPRECVLGGVCAGVARHLGVSVVAVRWGAVIAAVLGGGGVLLYLWLWALVPVEDAPGGPGVLRRVPVARVLYGVTAASAGALFLVQLFAVVSRSEPAAATALFAVLVPCAIAAVVWEEAVEVRGGGAAAAAWRIVAGATLVAVGLLGTVVVAGRVGSLWLFAFPVVLVVGLFVLVAPWAIATGRDLGRERTARVREEQRAEIAAHLHDSVLQTLALIQNRAGASSEVARIARAQERELREWLYSGGERPAEDVGEQLRGIAAELELEFPVRIDVVTVGEPPSAGAVDQLVAAAREAMLNAARHAGGDVSVYVEGSERAIDVFVRDRGDGFDLAAVPGDRLGVRESILGRMRRAGGSASVRAGSGGGTEVRLHLDTAGGENA